MNFKKVKKKMTPYDIKPSPNPRIEANLEFFLTDSKSIDPPISNDVFILNFFVNVICKGGHLN